MSQPLSTSCPPTTEGHPKTPAIKLPDGTIQHSTVLAPLPPPSAHRNGQLNLDTFSPVNENGSFEFDRVLKSGKAFRRVKHRHAFRASWKPAYLVLRPNLLSVYKDEENTRLRVSITLSEVTAVAPVRSPRSNRQHVFGIFSPSCNYRFQALSAKDAEEWVQRIRSETRVDEEEEAFLGRSSNTKKGGDNSFVAPPSRQRTDDTTDHSDFELAGRPSSPEIGSARSPGRYSTRLMSLQDYSANDATSYSEWSDGPTSSAGRPIKSKPSMQNLSSSAPVASTSHTSLARELARGNNPDLGVLRDPERVICEGYLHCLRIKGGVRQWKRMWAVLRPKNLAFYKDEQEYSAVRIIPMSHIIDAAEVDPLSRSKKFCLQIIAEEESYRFCTIDEESLAKWLGSLKSILVARKKLEPAPAA